ncbi:GntR family transcriptional regulator [Nakamurella silvestris]|nr:GntR family transcriptional regulator [Nakamurella silvestris]
MAHTPRYLVIATDIERRIRSGEWSPGQQMSTVEQMMDDYKENGPLVRDAMTVLKNAGWVEGRQGVGYFLTHAAPTGPADSQARVRSTLVALLVDIDVIRTKVVSAIAELD